MHTTHTAQCALEYWRASGKRNIARLRDLVQHFAETNGQTDFVHHHEESAIAAIRSWEIEA
jgi:hypothetical protein